MSPEGWCDHALIAPADAVTIRAMGIAPHLRTDIDAERAARSADAAIAALATRQHGVVSRRQLSALGIGRGAIGHRLATGRLQPLHRGVFAVGHTALAPEAAWMAAVLAAGDGAVLSHGSAGALWGVRGSGVAARVDVTVPCRRRTRPRLRVHEAALQPDEVTTHRGIPVTDPARTLLDLAAVLRPHQLERAINEAEYRRLASRLSLEALLARYPGRKGTVALRAIVEARAIGRTRTRNELEAAFLAVVDAHGLPRPATNRMIELPTGWVRSSRRRDGHGSRRTFGMACVTNVRERRRTRPALPALTLPSCPPPRARSPPRPSRCPPSPAP